MGQSRRGVLLGISSLSLITSLSGRSFGAALDIGLPGPELPEPAASVVVTNMQALQGEIINHPGTSWKRIILESGLYPGPLNVSKPRLQLCSRDLNGAVLTGTVTLSGAESLISRCKSTGGIVCAGSGTRVNRCLIQGGGGSGKGKGGSEEAIAADEGAGGSGEAIAAPEGGRGSRRDRKGRKGRGGSGRGGEDREGRGGKDREGRGGSGQDIVGIDVRGSDVEIDGNEITGTGNGILICDAVRPIVQRNWLHHQGSPPSDRNAWIYIGESRGTSALNQQALIQYNRLENAHHHQNIELKSSNNRVIGNTCVEGKAVANNFVRHGVGNYFALNWMIGSSAVVGASDRNTILIMNHGRAAIRAGQISGDQLRAGAKGIVYAEDTIVALHDGPIDLGWNLGVDRMAPQRTYIEDCDGPIIHTVPSDFTQRPLTVERPAGLFRELRPFADVGQLWS